MKIKGYYLALMLLGVILFTACNDDEGYSLNDFDISVATVENPNNQSAFIFVLDDGTKMWTAASYYPNYYPKDGQRILADYTILSDKENGAPYDHDVRLNGYYSILTKGIFNISNMNEQDSIGHDPITVKKMWIGNDYLNVEFTYPGGGKVHYITLATNDLADYPEGKLHLEFRHNAHDDPYGRALWGMASFNLRSLQVGGVSSLPIVIHWTSFDSPSGKMEEFEYRFNHMGIEPITFSLDEETGNIE